MSDNRQNSTLNGAVEDFFNTGNKSKVVQDSANLKAEMVKKPDDSLDQMVPPDYAKVIHAEEPKETTNETTSESTEEYHGLVTDDDEAAEDTVSQIIEEERQEEKREKDAEAARFKVTREDIAATMPDMDDKIREAKVKELYEEIKKYREELIVKYGMDYAAADEAAKNRALNEGKKANNEWLDNNPHTGVITIKKENADKLELTEEEHEKLEKVHAIQLVMIEDAEVATTRVVRPPRNKDKLRYIKSLSSSYFSMPMPILGDFVTFSSAPARNIIEAITPARVNEPATDELERKASFVYEHFVGSSNIIRYDPTDPNQEAMNAGKEIIHNFAEFCGAFPYADLDLAVYAIYVASSPSSYKIDLNCGYCSKLFSYDIVPKDMLNIDNTFGVRDENDTDDPKLRKLYTDILSHSSDNDFLYAIRSENKKTVIMKSPKTQTIYYIQNPSLSRAREILAYRGERDNGVIYVIASFINEIRVYDPSQDGYIVITPDENAAIIEYIRTMDQVDYTMILRLLQDRLYTLNFDKDSIECTNCHSNNAFTPEFDQLVFRLAQESSKEVI